MQPQMMPQGPGPFMQMAQQQGTPPHGMPPSPPAGGSAMPQGSPPMPPQNGGNGMAGIPPQILQMLQMIAKQGRGGDTMLAHLTPGEMEVPKEVQTPKVLATLNKAYKDKGVDPQQFTAGSPQSSMNPQTGLPEYNFLSAFLPAALGIAGGIVAPELLPAALGSPALLSAIGSGVGTAAGGMAAGQTPTQAALSGLGSGAGGYLLGGGLGGAGSAAAKIPTTDQALAMKMSNIDPASVGFGSQAASQAAGAMGPPAPGLSNLWGNLPPNSINPMRTIGSTIGGMVGSSIGAPPKSNGPAYPPGFNAPMTPVGSLPSAQQQLGMTNSKQPAPNFTGFNPATNYPAAYNFFPQA